MALHGTYEENLNSAGCGTLSITAHSWSIRYYFPGPDARHKGTFFTIRGEDVPGYIQAYKENWEEFQLLKKQIPAGGSFQKRGKNNMGINIGMMEGVCIDYFHIPIKDEKELTKMITSLESCITKAKSIMHMLKTENH